MKTVEQRMQEANLLMPQLQILKNTISILEEGSTVEYVRLFISGNRIDLGYSKERLEELKKETLEQTKKQLDTLIAQIDAILVGKE